MESFQKTCLFVATIVLIISLIIVGYIIQWSLSNQEFPAIKNLCPDYWDVDYYNDGNSQKLSCVNRLKHNNVNTCINANDASCNNFYTIDWNTEAGSHLKEDILCAKTKVAFFDPLFNCSIT